MNKLIFYSGAALIFASIFNLNPLSARELSIRGPSELKSALATVKPGDVITLKNGTWLNANLTVEKGGEPGKPVLIKSESPGNVIFSGASSLNINAAYVTVEGLLFIKGEISRGAVIAFNSHHGIVRNTAVVDYNPADLKTAYHWVYFQGDNNLVDRCYFKGKSNMGPLVGNSIVGRHNTVTHSYFKDIPYNENNGREIFRIWGYGRDEQLGEDGAFFTIQENLFDHADGEGQEIISLKSNHNMVLRNTIVATRGGIDIRSGNGNTIKGNIILGQGTPGSYGVRIAGQNHLVQGNYISGCSYGIKLTTGEFIDQDLTGNYQPVLRDETPLGRVPRYGQVKNLTLTANVLVANNSADLIIGGGYKSRWPESQLVLLPEGCLIQNNRFVQPEGKPSVTGSVIETNPPLDRFSFKPNKYIGNSLIGAANEFAPSNAGFKCQPVPANWTEAKESAAFKPLTPAEVGPSWVRTKGL